MKRSLLTIKSGKNLQHVKTKAMKTSDINQIKIDKVEKSDLIKELQEKLEAKQICHFVFKKKDGTQREAFGTIHPDWYIKFDGINDQVDSETQTQLEKRKEGITVYYDLQQLGWRSFITDNILIVY
ncbi:MAG: SH3 beta-barrel fold-containing protein [Leifsonia sp.]